MSFVLLLACGVSADGPGADAKDSDTNRPRQGDLVITEVMANPSVCSDARGEWFEVYNTTGSSISLDRLIFGRSDDQYKVGLVETSAVVGPYDYAIIGRAGMADCNSEVKPDAEYDLGPFLLNSSSTSLFIAFPGVGLIDETSVIPQFGSGVSTQLAATEITAESNDDITAWGAAGCAVGAEMASPGAKSCGTETLNECVSQDSSITVELTGTAVVDRAESYPATMTIHEFPTDCVALNECEFWANEIEYTVGTYEGRFQDIEVVRETYGDVGYIGFLDPGWWYAEFQVTSDDMVLEGEMYLDDAYDEAGWIDAGFRGSEQEVGFAFDWPLAICVN